jgi:hypothetical protein
MAHNIAQLSIWSTQRLPMIQSAPDVDSTGENISKLQIPRMRRTPTYDDMTRAGHCRCVPLLASVTQISPTL